jgi:hypothetical protein
MEETKGVERREGEGTASRTAIEMGMERGKKEDSKNGYTLSRRRGRSARDLAKERIGGRWRTESNESLRRIGNGMDAMPTRREKGDMMRKGSEAKQQLRAIVDAAYMRTNCMERL